MERERKEAWRGGGGVAGEGRRESRGVKESPGDDGGPRLARRTERERERERGKRNLLRGIERSLRRGEAW